MCGGLKITFPNEHIWSERPRNPGQKSKGTILVRRKVLQWFSHVCERVCSAMSYSLQSHGSWRSPPGSSVHGILQARILEWVAISSSKGTSQPRDQTLVSCVSCSGRRILCHWVTRGSPITLLQNVERLERALHPWWAHPVRGGRGGLGKRWRRTLPSSQTCVLPSAMDRRGGEGRMVNPCSCRPVPGVLFLVMMLSGSLSVGGKKEWEHMALLPHWTSKR